MALSPRTQSMMQVPTQQDTQEAFEQGFGDNAIRVFTSKFPELANMMAAFKIISSDAEKGNALGAFLLSAPDSTVLIPVIMASNAMKPFEVLYHQETDTYVPLDRRWLNEIVKKSSNAMGGPVETPKTLNHDVDIRNQVIPPYVGRYSYAAAGGQLGSGEALAFMLARAPNNIKRAFVEVLQKSHGALKYAFETFEKGMLLEALQPHAPKTAAPRIQWLAPNDSPERFQGVFGTDAPKAFQIATKLGYVAQDLREKTALLVEQGPIRFSEIYSSGFYRFQKTDGTTVQALVICNPMNLAESGVADRALGPSKAPDHYFQHHVPLQDEVSVFERDRQMASLNQMRNQGFLVYTENGDLFSPVDARWAPVAMPLDRKELSGRMLEVLNGKGDKVTPGARGIFVNIRANGIDGTQIVSVNKVTYGKDNVRRIQGSYDFNRVTMVTDPKSPITKIIARKDDNLMYIPQGMLFLAEKEASNDPFIERDFVTSASANLMLQDGLRKTGAVELTLQKTDLGGFIIKRAEWAADFSQVLGQRFHLNNEKEAVEVFMHDGVSFHDSVSAVKTAAAQAKASFFVLTEEQRIKLAQGPAIDPSMAAPPPGAQLPPGDPNAMAADPNAMPPGDPNAMAADPMAMQATMPMQMAPPMPPPPSPVDLAVADVSAAYAQQTAAIMEELTSQQRSLADRLSVLREVKQRADAIAGSQQGGMVPPPIEITPPSEFISGAFPEGGMPPDAAGAPNASENELASMDQAPPPGVPMEGGLPVDMGSSMETAANTAEKLNDPQVFEATALANLAANPDLKELSADYIPAMEDTLDHLARMLLTLWLNEGEYNEALGDEDYTALEDKLRSVFNNLGDLILLVNQGVPKSNATGTEL